MVVSFHKGVVAVALNLKPHFSLLLLYVVTHNASLVCGRYYGCQFVLLSLIINYFSLLAVVGVRPELPPDYIVAHGYLERPENDCRCAIHHGRARKHHYYKQIARIFGHLERSFSID